MRWLLIFLIIFPACGLRESEFELTDWRAPPIRRETIVLDAGHGGKDGGTTSKRDRYEEKELNMMTTFITSNYLKQMGYNVILTRSHDVFLPLSARAELANSTGADLFISIHYNYSTNREAQGIEVFYYKEKAKTPSERVVRSKDLSKSVLCHVLKETGALSRGIKEANFAVIRETTMPAILIEGGFLSNPQERDKVYTPRYQRQVAKGIAEGIDHYLSLKRKS